MKVNSDKLNPKVREIMGLVQNIKPDIPENLLLILISYTFSEVASNLRAKMKLYDGTTKPLNFYAYIFGESGVGKDVSLNALNRIFIDKFSQKMSRGFDKHKTKYWEQRAMALVDQDVEDVEAQIKEEMKLVSPFSYRISSGTEAGVSKARVTSGYYKIGAVNLVIDELGANYPKLRELLSLMLSSYEDGNTEARMLKNESVMAVKGVPSNFLGYSSPALVFDGGLTEKALMDDMSQGFARRSFCAYALKPEKEKLTAKEMVARSRAKADGNEAKMKEMNTYFESLANPKNMYKELPLTEEAELAIAEYQIKCDGIVEKTKNISEQERLELINRPWKAQRLAGVYSFISKSDDITAEFVEQAIYVAEVSGLGFQKVMNQPPTHQRLFEFIAGREKTTEVDLAKKKWYGSNSFQKKEAMSLARAYAFENDHLFKIKETEGVSFYSFIPMPKTDVDNIKISISNDLTKGYKSKRVPFEVIHEVMGNPKYCYSMTKFSGGHRNKKNAERGQVLLPFDIDDGLKLTTAQKMFSNYKCMTITTKSHQKDKNGLTVDRFRLVFIMDRKLDLSPDDYARFIKNSAERLGIGSIIDQAATDVSRGFFGAKGEHWYSDGVKLFEVADMIPETEKERERSTALNSSGVGSADGMERFLLEEAMVGSRNNICVKWALFLKDEGYDFESAKQKVLDFNAKLPEPLPQKELLGTVIKTLQRSYSDTD